MRLLGPSFALLAACSAPAARVELPSHTASAASIATQTADAIEDWRRLAPTHATFNYAMVPDDLRPRLKLAILRDAAHFSCTHLMNAPRGCVARPILAPVPDSAGVDDPCFRHEVALAMIVDLDHDELVALGARALAALVAVTPIDRAFDTVLLEQIAEVAPELLLATMIAARDAGVAYSALPLASLPQDQVAAAAKHHIYPPSTTTFDRATSLAIISDTHVPASDRDAVLAAYEVSTATTAGPAPLAKDVFAAYANAARDPDCTLAMHAADALASHGDTSFLPQRPHTTSVEANTHTLCMLAAYFEVLGGSASMTQMLAALTAYHDPRSGLYLASHRFDGVSNTPTLAEHFTAASPWVPSATEGDLLAALAACRGARCALWETSADLTFATAPDGGLYLEAAASTEHVSACAGFTQE